MQWVMTVIFTTLFSYAGWYVGASIDMAVALFLSLIGLVGGWLAARRFMAWLDQ